MPGAYNKVFEPDQENITLIGLRGSGKTTLARALSRKLDLQFVDTDQKLQEKFGQSIADFVQESGWSEFRRQEQEVLQQVLSKRGQVVATGGGCVLLAENRELISAQGAVFYLMADVSLLVNRLQANPGLQQRPRFTAGTLTQELAQSLQEREGFYLQCLDYILQAERSVQDLVQDALQMLGLQGREISTNSAG